MSNDNHSNRHNSDFGRWCCVALLSCHVVVGGVESKDRPAEIGMSVVNFEFEHLSTLISPGETGGRKWGKVSDLCLV